MLRTALFALLLIATGGGQYLGGAVALIAASWDAEVSAGSSFDLNGQGVDAGGRFDPNGLQSDAGNIFDPDGRP